ncbi:MAG TPA: hypothetical protein VLX28_23920 [Thermoanaerobaculia bacterium]|nr:hypothetical protein [Thermoanaerobaculia bacterium]
MKKLSIHLSLLCLLALLLVPFAGCKKDEEPAEETPVATSESTTTETSTSTTTMTTETTPPAGSDMAPPATSDATTPPAGK